MPDFSKKIVYLSQAQYQELITNESITVNGVTVNYNDNDIYVTPQAEPITDVRVNGTSISSNGIANIPLGSMSDFGVFKTNNGFGITSSSGTLLINGAGSEAVIKPGSHGYYPLVPSTQHISVFYGLSKVAGVDLANETVTLGTYPNSSKAAIQKMLGIDSLLAPNETDPFTSAHAIGDLFTMNGSLYRAKTAIAAADAVNVGTNCEVTSVSEAFATNANLDTKADKTDTVLTTTLSMGRKANTTVGINSVALGNDITASGNYSHAEGQSTFSQGTHSHAEGYGSLAKGNYSHAEGYNTKAMGNYSHVSGYGTRANGDYSYAEGINSIANGACSYVIGKYNVEDSYATWPEWVANTEYVVGDKVKVTNGTTVTGYICKTANSDASFTSSKWGSGSRMNYAEIIGNGSSTTASNAYALDWDGNGHFAGNVYVGANADSTGGVRVPHDVQVNGTSIISSGVANIPVASAATLGVVKVDSANGVSISSTTDKLLIAKASDAAIKAGTNDYTPIVPANQQKAAFYGLAKAAGDTTQSASSNAIGTYTAEAKAAIRSMLDIQSSIYLIETISGTTPSITATPNIKYICGEVTTISITPPASGTCDVIFESGSTAATLTVPNTVKWPSWFDATSLETDTIYELMITDATYGSVMTWATT